MRMMASQITSVSIVHSTVCSGADQRIHQSSVSLAFVSGIHRWPMNSPHKGQITRKMLPFDDVIMLQLYTMVFYSMVFSNFLKYPSSTFQKTQLTMNPFMFILMSGFGEATSHIAAKIACFQTGGKSLFSAMATTLTYILTLLCFNGANHILIFSLATQPSIKISSIKTAQSTDVHNFQFIEYVLTNL